MEKEKETEVVLSSFTLIKKSLIFNKISYILLLSTGNLYVLQHFTNFHQWYWSTRLYWFCNTFGTMPTIFRQYYQIIPFCFSTSIPWKVRSYYFQIEASFLMNFEAAVNCPQLCFLSLWESRSLIFPSSVKFFTVRTSELVFWRRRN